MQVQAYKHLLVETEDNSEQMPKEEVEAVKRPCHGLTKILDKTNFVVTLVL